jgi:hypothetical protein
MVPGVIESAKGPFVEPDHGILTTQISFKADDGYQQGFGGICLDKESAPSWVAALCSTFGVYKIEDLKGSKCFALYSFGRHNDAIDGLISVDTGKKLVIDTWRRKLYPAQTKNRLIDEQSSIERNIVHWQYRIEESKKTLKTLKDIYVDWEKQQVEL